MLKQLRIKFIAINMTMIAVVLVIIFAAIGYTSYQNSMSAVHTALESAIDRSGTRIESNPGFGDLGDGRDGKQGSDVKLDTLVAPNSSDNDSTENPADNDNAANGENAANANANGRQGTNSEFNAPQIGGGRQSSGDLIPLAVYYQVNETLVAVPETTTAMLSDEVLALASGTVSSLSAGAGELTSAGLHYFKKEVNGVTYVAFADSSSTDAWQSQVLLLVVAGVIMLLAFFVLSLFFSKWALKPVKDAWDAQKQFVTDASHELKTPLTVVLANSSILLKHPQDSVASQSQWIESTQIEAENMQSLVNEMLELAHVESKQMIAHDPVNLAEIVEGIALQFESVAFERGFDLETDIAENVTVAGDAQKLSKMASTLIENATKYVEVGGTVRVALAKIGSNAVLTVTNTGQTIAQEDLPHIFDRFYRTDKARTSGTGGFGLGLAIARETARAHNGDITVQSSVTEGTTFRATLPLSE